MEDDETRYGHRQRLNERFLKSPIRTVPDYEVLEMLLFYVIPIKDTKSIAKNLLRKFGSLIEVLDADQTQLIEIKGVGQSVIIYFKLLKDLFSRLHIPSDLEKKFYILNNWGSVINYCNLTMGFQKTESFKILYLNAKNILIHEEVIDYGTVDRIAIHPREIVKSALTVGASALILVHNHPSGDVSPSKQDIELTNTIATALRSINVTIHDHIIVSRNDYYSFKTNNLIKT
ncbi:RadC family protein [Candidatus Bandiella euplotis]|nr:DNA repair protein RadC [Candidatus Bandiella woodruffii]